EEYEAFLLNPSPWVTDSDSVTRRWNEVARFSRLAGFGEPPPVVEAALMFSIPGRPPISRNRQADELWKTKFRALRQRAQEAGAANLESNPPVPAEQGDAGTDHPPQTPNQKRSTAKGEARTKIISALTAYHQYADGGCLNLGPIAVRELARVAEVAPDS